MSRTRIALVVSTVMSLLLVTAATFLGFATDVGAADGPAGVVGGAQLNEGNVRATLAVSAKLTPDGASGEVSEHAAIEGIAQGTYTADVICVSVTGNEARVIARVRNATGLYAGSQTIFLAFHDNGNPEFGEGVDQADGFASPAPPPVVNPPGCVPFTPATRWGRGNFLVSDGS
jgi:hypothetical protein